MEHFAPFVGILSANTDKMLNDIDIAAVYVKNLEPSHYTDSGELEQERLTFLMKK